MCFDFVFVFEIRMMLASINTRAFSIESYK